MKTMAKLVIAIIITLYPWLALSQEQPQPKATDKGDRIQIKLNYWNPNYVGKFEIGDINIRYQDGNTSVPAEIKSTSLDMEDDLGVENPQNILGFEVGFQVTKRWRSTWSYYNVDLGGGGTLSQDTYILGYPLPAGSQLKVDLSYYCVGVKNSLTLYDKPKLSIGIYSALDVYAWNFSFEGQSVFMDGTTVEKRNLDESQSIPIPLITMGVDMRVNLPSNFTLTGSLGGTGFDLADQVEDVDEFYMKYLEWQLGVAWRYKWLSLGLGWRSINTEFKLTPDIKIDQNEAKTSMPMLKYEIDNSGLLLSLGAVF